LSLLVLLVRTDHTHDPTPPHDLALVANPLHRCPHLHCRSPPKPRRTRRTNPALRRLLRAPRALSRG